MTRVAMATAGLLAGLLAACGGAYGEGGSVAQPACQLIDDGSGCPQSPANTLPPPNSFVATFAATGKPFTDPGTTSSITYLLDGGALDAYGTTITAVGTIPVSTATPFYPNGFSAPAAVGAGNLDDTHYFTIPTPGAWDLPGPGFSTCSGYTLTQVATFPALGGKHNGNADGWSLLMDGADRPSMWMMNASTLTQVVDNATIPLLNGVSLMCAGVIADGGVGFIESDLDVPTSATKVTGDPTAVTLSAPYLPNTATPARIGSALPGGGWAGFVTHGKQVWNWVSTTPATSALLKLASRTFFGMVADTGQSLLVYQPSTTTVPINGTRWAIPAYVLAINESGAKVNEASTNYLFPALNPPTQTTPDLPVGTYTGWIEGSGSMMFAAGGASTTGLPCVAIAGTANDCHFTVTAHGTVVATASGTVTAGQLEPKAARTDLINSIGAALNRAAEQLFVPSIDIVDPTSDTASATITPAPLATASTSNLTVWANPVGATTQRLVHLGSNNKWELQVAGQTVDSAALPLTAGTAVALSWKWSTTTPVCLTVNGVQTCSGGNGAVFLPGAELYLDSDATDGANASLGAIRWAPRASYSYLTIQAQATACIGDSLMASGSSPPGGAPATCETLATLAGPKWNTTDFAVYGDTTPQIAAQYTASVKGKGFKVLVVEGGINDIGGGQSAAYVEGQIQPTLDDAVASGMVIALLAITPWNGTGNPSAVYPWTAGQQTQTTLYNAWLAAYAVAHPTKVVYVDTYTAFGSAADATKQSAPLLDYGDSLHHTQLGYNYQAQLTRDALVTLPAGSFQ